MGGTSSADKVQLESAPQRVGVTCVMSVNQSKNFPAIHETTGTPGMPSRLCENELAWPKYQRNKWNEKRTYELTIARMAERFRIIALKIWVN